MARINSNTVVQLVGNDRIVIVEDSSAQEIVIPMPDISRLIEMLVYLQEAARKDAAGEAEPARIVYEFSDAEDFREYLRTHSGPYADHTQDGQQ